MKRQTITRVIYTLTRREVIELICEHATTDKGMRPVGDPEEVNGIDSVVEIICDYPNTEDDKNV